MMEAAFSGLDPVLVQALAAAVSLVLLVGAVQKVRNWEQFRAALANYRLLPDALVLPVALVLPMLETIAGIALLAGPFRAAGNSRARHGTVPIPVLSEPHPSSTKLTAAASAWTSTGSRPENAASIIASRSEGGRFGDTFHPSPDRELAGGISKPRAPS